MGHYSLVMMAAAINRGAEYSLNKSSYISVVDYMNDEKQEASYAEFEICLLTELLGLDSKDYECHTTEVSATHRILLLVLW